MPSTLLARVPLEYSCCFSELYSHAFEMYGNPSQLICALESSSVILESQRGVHQGDPFRLAVILRPPTKRLEAFNDFKCALEPAKRTVCDYPIAI